MDIERLDRIEVALAVTDCSPEQHLQGMPCLVEDAGWLCGELRKALKLLEDGQKALEAAWQEYVRKLLLGMPLTNISPERSMPEGTLVRWMPAEAWDTAVRQLGQGQADDEGLTLSEDTKWRLEKSLKTPRDQLITADEMWQRLEREQLEN